MNVPRRILVTGGNSGIGFECAKRLASEGCRVIIASRDRQASRRAIEQIANEVTGAEVEEMGLDLGSLASVRACAKELASRQDPLHAVVCNAGLQMNTGPVQSADGYELTFAVNHLGHFLLVNLLLEKLLASAPARVVVVSSGVHDPKLPTGMPKPAIDDLEALAATGVSKGAAFNGRLAYVHSKLCNLWFTYELVRRIEAAGIAGDARPLSVNAFEPGLVPGSGLARDYAPVARFVWDYVLPVLRYVLPMVNSPQRSGSALADLTLDPELERVSGRYFPSHTRFRQGASSPESHDETRAAALWDASVRWSGLAPGESPLV